MKNLKLTVLFLGLSLTGSICSMDGDIDTIEGHQSVGDELSPDNGFDTLKGMERTGAGTASEPSVSDQDDWETASNDVESRPSTPDNMIGQSGGASDIGVSSFAPNVQEMDTHEADVGLDLNSSQKSNDFSDSDEVDWENAVLRSTADRTARLPEEERIRTDLFGNRVDREGNLLSSRDRALDSGSGYMDVAPDEDGNVSEPNEFRMGDDEADASSDTEFDGTLDQIKELGVSKSADEKGKFTINRLDDLLQNEDLTPEQRARVVKMLDDYERYVRERSKNWFSRRMSRLEGNEFYDYQNGLTKEQLRDLKKNRNGKMRDAVSLSKIISAKEGLTSDDHLGLATRVGGVNFSDGYDHLQTAYEKATDPTQAGKVLQYQDDYKQYLNDIRKQEKTGNRINTQQALDTGNRFHIQHLKDAGYDTTGAQIKDDPSQLALSSESDIENQDARHKQNLGQYYYGGKSAQRILDNYNVSDARSLE